jgi:urease subunit beta
VRPGEIDCRPGSIELAPGRRRHVLVMRNTSDRPIGIGSHAPLEMVSRALELDRDAARRMRLDVPAGEIVWFAAGEERHVRLVALGGQAS